MENSTNDKVKNAAIMLAVELDSAFKLYSYRIISHETYIERTTELVQLFNKETKNPAKNVK